MSDTVEIREEQPADVPAIRRVNQLAFGQDQEANIVGALRVNGAVILSLVATRGDIVIGHILYSPIALGDVTGAALGPMAVLPGMQRQGVGSRLVEAGNRLIAERGYPCIILVGH